MKKWNPGQYLQFEAQRTLPAQDLAAKIPTAQPGKILDVGCGPGNSTRVLRQKFPHAQILGTDNSPDMISAAKAAYPKETFCLCDAEHDLPTLGNDFDIVYSNACLQWVPGHKTLLPAMMNLLRPGGALAVQIPMSFEQPIYSIVASITQSEKWQSYFSLSRVFYTLSPEEYYDILAPLSGKLEMWQTTYYHIMPNHQSILSWYCGTALRPYLQALPATLQPEFEQEIFTLLQKAYPACANGQILFRFPRLFFVAQRVAAE